MEAVTNHFPKNLEKFRNISQFDLIKPKNTCLTFLRCLNINIFKYLPTDQSNCVTKVMNGLYGNIPVFFWELNCNLKKVHGFKI